MVRIALQINANLENLTGLRPDKKDYYWCLKFKCNNCHETTDKFQMFDGVEAVELKNSRGTAHFLLKCKFCDRENNLNVIANSMKEYNAEDSETWKTIVEFECRGFEPVEFAPHKPWFARGAESKTPFKQINLDEDDYVEYDEKTGESVGIYEMKGRFVKL